MEIKTNFNSIKAYNDPIDYYIIDDFVSEELGLALSSQFPEYNSQKWYSYDNPLERKKAIQFWGHFQPETYQFFQHLCSNDTVNRIKELTKNEDLDIIPDIGLHGAGQHMSGNGDHLNIHLDYSIHPLADKQRKYNIILYLTPEWKPEYGGNLELWSHDRENETAKERVATIECKFRRAVIFDTTQNSWHGFPQDIICPEETYRKSLAMYYLTPKPLESVNRKRALYSPREDQRDNQEIKELIKKRASI